MAKNTNRKLSLKKETLRQLDASQLSHAVGGVIGSLANCAYNQDTRTLGSTIPAPGDVYSEISRQGSP